jgi:hypothetical protein
MIAIETVPELFSEWTVIAIGNERRDKAVCEAPSTEVATRSLPASPIATAKSRVEEPREPNLIPSRKGARFNWSSFAASKSASEMDLFGLSVSLMETSQARPLA